MISIHYYSRLENFEKKKIIKEVFSGNISIVVGEIKCKLNEISKLYLTKNELERMGKYIKVDDKVNYLVTHSIVNLIFSEILNCDINTINLKKTNNNKPYVENEQNIDFNISHSKNCIAVAFSKRRVGIDVEFINQCFSFREIIEMAFSQKEAIFIKNNPTMFFKTWVAKEAFLKYQGIGLLKDIEMVEVEKFEEENFVITDKENKIRKSIIIKKIFDNYLMGICFD